MNGTVGGTLPKEEILSRRSDFDSLFGSGEKTRSGCLIIMHREAMGRKVGFAVSRRIRGAVKKNRVRRLLREAYRKNREKMRSDREFIIIVGETGLGKTYSELEEDLVRGLIEAGIIRD